MVIWISAGSQSASRLDIWFDEPDRPIGRLDILSSEQRQQILVEWNSTAQPLPKTTLPNLFEAQRTSPLQPLHPAYVIYTSGSTGTPNIILASKFVPRCFDGDLLLFIASRNATEPRRRIWTTHAKRRIGSYEIACEHANMLDPGPLGESASLLALELKRRTNRREES